MRTNPKILAGLILFVLPGFVNYVRSQTSSQMPPGRGSLVESDGAQLYYQECGAGKPTVILLHDGVVDSAVWDQVWPEFCGQFHTIRYDRRGYGHSPADAAWYSEADDLIGLLHHLNVSHTVLVGSSHGASLSIDFTLAHPDLVQCLVLIGSVVRGHLMYLEKPADFSRIVTDFIHQNVW
jgi:3-oxoadipate enol-lactonase